MAQRTEDGLISVKEYLEIEERSEARHEYVGGMLYAMAGRADRHNRIAFNTSHHESWRTLPMTVHAASTSPTCESRLARCTTTRM